MVRPLKEEKSVKDKIQTVFWELLCRKSFSQITVSELVQKVPCNRATFYYYYDNTEALARDVIEKILPKELPRIALDYFAGSRKTASADAAALSAISQLSVLPRKDGPMFLKNMVEDALQQMWIEQFGLTADTRDAEIVWALEFLAGGVVSLFSRNVHNGAPEDVQACMQLINALFAGPTLALIQSKQPPS